MFDEQKQKGAGGESRDVESALFTGGNGKGLQKKVKCFRCGKVGHIRRECRVNLNHSNSDSSGSFKK